MAELTLLVNSTDTALLNGSAMSPAASGAVAGGFAGVLGAQLAPGEGAVATESPPLTNDSVASVELEGGDANPVSGKPLPSTAVPMAVAPLANAEPAAIGASLLAVIAQGLPSGSNATSNAPVAAAPLVMENGVPLMPAEALPGSATQRAWMRSLAANNPSLQQSVTRPTLAEVPVVSTNLNPAQQAVRSTPPLLTDVQQQAQLVATAAAIPAQLGKPISEAARQTLARVSQGVGSAKSLRADMPTTFTGTMLSNGQTLGVTNSVAGMNTAMRMDVVNAAMNNAAQAGPGGAELKLVAQPVLASSAQPDDIINAQFGIPRLNASPITGTLPTLTVATPVGQQAWGTELGQRVTWLANNELREARLQLNPRSLGAVEVRIVYGLDQQLNVSFNAANPVARDALEASLPRLREMLEQQGLQLTDANVSHQSPEDKGQRKAAFEMENARDEMRAPDDELDISLVANASASIWRGEGMLDAYA